MKPQTLKEAALNPDGETYNGAKALAWLTKALHPETTITEEEILKVWEEVKRVKQ